MRSLLHILAPTCALLACRTTIAQSVTFSGMPANTTIVEVRALPPPSRANRALVLWMVNPKAFPRHNQEQVRPDDKPDVYTCPEETRGWFYRGATRVSLVDTGLGKIINTVEIRDDQQDQFDIPYRIQPKYYRVDPPLIAGEGKPVIMDLKDYNGDGAPLEFGIFDAESCSVHGTQLIGYSQRHDRVIRYPICLKGTWYGKRDPKLLWLDEFLLQQPTQGVWEYSLRYNAGDTAQLKIRYDPVSESFRGTVEWKTNR